MTLAFSAALVSVYDVLATVLPSSVLALAITNAPAAVTEIRSEIRNGQATWFTQLPTSVQSYLRSLGDGQLSLAATSTASTASVGGHATSSVASSAATPTQSSSPSNPPPPSPSHCSCLSAGAVAGIGVGTGLAVVISALGAFLLFWRRARPEEAQHMEVQPMVLAEGYTEEARTHLPVEIGGTKVVPEISSRAILEIGPGR